MLETARAQTPGRVDLTWLKLAFSSLIGENRAMRRAMLILHGALFFSACNSGGQDCSPGAEGCECAEGKCLEGLSCLSNLCVEPAGSSSSSSGGTPACMTSQDCAAEEVCHQEQCVDAWSGVEYGVKLLEVDPGTCPGDEYCYSYYVEFDRMSLDPDTECRSACPVSWPGVGPVNVKPTDAKEAFQLDVLLLGDLTVETPTLLCWSKDSSPKLIEDCYPDLNDVCDCGPIPKTVLHDGQWKGYAYDVYLNVEFAVSN